MNVKNNVCTLCLSLLLVSCITSSQISSPIVDATHKSIDQISFGDDYQARDVFGLPPQIMSADEIFKLDTDQIADFTTYLENLRDTSTPTHRQLYNYLDLQTNHFSFKGKTLTASETLRQHQGNCMSLAILTTALAKVAKVKLAYQLVDSEPVYDKRDNLVIKGVHVRSKLYKNEMVKSADGTQQLFNYSGLVVDYFPSGRTHLIQNIDENQFVARYFRNVAVEKMQISQLGESYWYAREALRYAPAHPEGFNLLAVIYKRAGLHGKAEQTYLRGMEIDQANLTLLKNYRQFLLAQNRTADAAVVSEKLLDVDDPSPFNLISLGDELLEEGKTTAAIKTYNKSIEKAAYLPDGYLGLARAYYLIDRLGKSEEMLKKAISLEDHQGDQRLYQAKLSALSDLKNR